MLKRKISARMLLLLICFVGLSGACRDVIYLDTKKLKVADVMESVADSVLVLDGGRRVVFIYDAYQLQMIEKYYVYDSKNSLEFLFGLGRVGFWLW